MRTRKRPQIELPPLGKRSKVTERGQITIDESIRKQLGIEPGMTAYQRIVRGRLEIVFLPPPFAGSQLGVFHNPDQPPLTRKAIEEAIMETMAEKLDPGAQHSAGVQEIYSFDLRFDRSGMVSLQP